MSDYEGDEYKFTREQQRQLDKHRDERKAHSAGDKKARERIGETWKPFNHNAPDSGAGKGDKERPNSISREEYGLRYDLATGRITAEEFELEMEKFNDR